MLRIQIKFCSLTSPCTYGTCGGDVGSILSYVTLFSTYWAEHVKRITMCSEWVFWIPKELKAYMCRTVLTLMFQWMYRTTYGGEKYQWSPSVLHHSIKTMCSLTSILIYPKTQKEMHFHSKSWNETCFRNIILNMKIGLASATVYFKTTVFI